MLRSHCSVCRCYLSLATTNALARGSLKDAANCVTHLELQISEKDKDSERILRVGLQLTWLAVTAICSRPNSEVWMVFSCCRLLSADVIVAVSVPSFRAPIVFHVIVFDPLVCIVCIEHFFARSRPVTGLPAEFKHINKWRSKN